MPELFVPPSNPSFVWNVTDQFSTIESGGDRGHRMTRARRDRKLRTWRLQWINCPQGDLDYLRAFFEYHLGAAVAFSWALPHRRVYTPGPAFFGATAVQGTSGSLADGVIDIAYSFGNGALSSETLISPIFQLTITGGSGTARVEFTAPPRFPADAESIGIYMVEGAGGTLSRQAQPTTPGGTSFYPTISTGGQAIPPFNQMQGTPLVNIVDEPEYDMVAADVWVVTAVFRELLA